MRVALVGHMRSGKDSVASALRHLYPGLQPISFASALKCEAAKALNATRRAGDDPFFNEAFFNDDANRPRFRTFLQWYGTEYRRNQDPDYWVRVVEQEIIRNPAANWVCTDARFTNELEMLRRMGFKIVQLQMRVEEVADYLSQRGLSREQISEQLSHPSENEWKDVKADALFFSTFGNLPRLTAEVVGFLTAHEHVEQSNVEPKKVDRETLHEIERYFAALYPAIYGSEQAHA